MSLSDYQAERRQIVLKGGTFEVEGVSLETFGTLLQKHLPDLETLFDSFEKVTTGRAEITEADIEKIVIAVAQQAPDFVASLIALSSGEATPASLTAAKRLPAPVQVKVILDIVDLTFGEVGGIKKAFESVVGLLPQRLTQATPPSLNHR